jgi:hypothetical protein
LRVCAPGIRDELLHPDRVQYSHVRLPLWAAVGPFAFPTALRARAID